MEIASILNVKITFNINCYCHQNQEKCPAQKDLYFEHISENETIFVWMIFLLASKNNV